MTAPRQSGTIRHPSGQRQAVYLLPERRVRVVAEGESLAVLEGPVLIARIPLARADRVLCNERVDWSGRALASCLAHGLPIAWVDGGGRSLGGCTPNVRRLPELHELMLRYLDMSDWPDKLDDWLRRKRLEILLRVADSRSRSGSPFRPGEVEQLKRSYVYRDESPSADESFTGWFDSFVAARLGRAGLGPIYRGYAGRELPLARIFARLLCSEFSMETGALLASGTESAARPLFFETWREHANRRLEDLVGSFCGHIARETDAWQ